MLNTQIRILPSRETSPMTSDHERELKKWEDMLGSRLSSDCRIFLLQFNAGSPHPNIFDEVTPDAVLRGYDTQAVCDRLYDLEQAMSSGKGNICGDAVPPGFVFFGQNPGGLAFLISLREVDFGAVFLWQGATNRWGVDGNDEPRLFRQADSFGAFLCRRYDTLEQSDHRHWATPDALNNARIFEWEQGECR